MKKTYIIPELEVFQVAAKKVVMQTGSPTKNFSIQRGNAPSGNVAYDEDYSKVKGMVNFSGNAWDEEW